MEIIVNNPFRIAGLFANSSERELQKNKAKIKAYLKVGKEIIFDTDFPFLPEIQRDENLVNYAFSRIQQSQDKVHYGLFWFLNLTAIDETAINYLKKGDIEKAKEIWSKLTIGKEINIRNYSAFNNLGTLLLSNTTVEELKQGLQIKIKLINSENFQEFAHNIADKTFSINNEHQLERFISEAIKGLESSKRMSKNEIILLSTNLGQQAEKIIIEKFIDGPINNIEVFIESTKKKRKENKAGAYKLGAVLFNKTKNDLKFLRELLGNNNTKYKFIADNLAKELLQCGIDYFNYWVETDNDPCDNALKLLKVAQTIAVSPLIKDRIEDNIAGVKEWIETKVQREKEELIQDDLEFIGEQIELCEQIEPNEKPSIIILKAAKFLDVCVPRLNNIKNVLGENDEFYIRVSSTIVSITQEMIVSAVNFEQELTKYLLQAGFGNALNSFKERINSALKITKKMSKLDMDPELREQFNKNYKILKSIAGDIEKAEMRINSASYRSTSRSTSSSEGCYIATMIYGDYNHPRVIRLRSFRDNNLKTNILGKLFIHYYYKFSPKLVEILDSHDKINGLLKKILDKITNLLNQE